jgi:TonB family protein
VPRDGATWSDERIRIVLGHELAHVRRGDWAVQLLADCVRSAYWFNPLAWVACWRLRLESEHACDDAVLRLGVAAPDYATQLLDLARLFRHSRRSFFPAPAMARPSDLERRVRVMLNERIDRSPVGRLSGWIVALALVALTVPIAGLSLSAVRADTPPVGVSPRIADIVLPAPPPTMRAPEAPVAAVPRAASPSRPSETGPQAAVPATFMVAVSDQAGRLVPNVKVVLSNALTGEGKEGATDQSGEFRVANLAPGDYQVTVSRPGFKTLKPAIRLGSGQLGTVRVTLQLGMLAETIVVSAKPGVAPPAVGAAQPGVATPTGTITPQARRIGAAPTEDPCSQSAEGGCVTPPRKLVDAKPIYPARAMEAGTSGTVVIMGHVGTDGRIGDMQPAPDANPDFADAAMQAVRLWEFSPTRLNGVPVEVQVEVTVMFVAVKK